MNERCPTCESDDPAKVRVNVRGLPTHQEANTLNRCPDPFHYPTPSPPKPCICDSEAGDNWCILENRPEALSEGYYCTRSRRLDLSAPPGHPDSPHPRAEDQPVLPSPPKPEDARGYGPTDLRLTKSGGGEWRIIHIDTVVAGPFETEQEAQRERRKLTQPPSPKPEGERWRLCRPAEEWSGPERIRPAGKWRLADPDERIPAGYEVVEVIPASQAEAEVARVEQQRKTWQRRAETAKSIARQNRDEADQAEARYEKLLAESERNLDAAQDQVEAVSRERDEAQGRQAEKTLATIQKFLARAEAAEQQVDELRGAIKDESRRALAKADEAYGSKRRRQWRIGAGDAYDEMGHRLAALSTDEEEG